MHRRNIHREHHTLVLSFMLKQVSAKLIENGHCVITWGTSRNVIMAGRVNKWSVGRLNFVGHFHILVRMLCRALMCRTQLWCWSFDVVFLIECFPQMLYDRLKDVFTVRFERHVGKLLVVHCACVYIEEKCRQSVGRLLLSR